MINQPSSTRNLECVGSCNWKAEGITYDWIHMLKVICLSLSISWLSSGWFHFPPASLPALAPTMTSSSSRLTSYQFSILPVKGKGEPLVKNSSRSPEVGTHWPGLAHTWANNCGRGGEVGPGSNSELGSKEPPSCLCDLGKALRLSLQKWPYHGELEMVPSKQVSH